MIGCSAFACPNMTCKHSGYYCPLPPVFENVVCACTGATSSLHATGRAENRSSLLGTLPEVDLAQPYGSQHWSRMGPLDTSTISRCMQPVAGVIDFIALSSQGADSRLGEAMFTQYDLPSSGHELLSLDLYTVKRSVVNAYGKQQQ